VEENFEIVHLELKYCERCGGLWIRAMHDGGVYCPRCSDAMAEMAPPSHTYSKTRPRMPGTRLPASDADNPHDLNGHNLDGSTDWIAIYGVGGHA